MINLRRKHVFVLTTLIFSLLLFTTILLRDGIHAIPLKLHPDPGPPRPKYKPPSTAKNLPIVDNFPLAAGAYSAADLPPIPSWNAVPEPHLPEKTPLFIGFTRNWRLLQQAVVSYITAGWPPSDIYVVENTGVMTSNQEGLLSLQNPFFLNHTRLHLLGVNVLITPTLLTFAQLQNFYIWTAIQNNWTIFFWSHMDVVVLSDEAQYAETNPNAQAPYENFTSLYRDCVAALREASSSDPTTSTTKPWALYFFSYDRLALVNAEAYTAIGGWDTQIPFYMGDCDMHERLTMAGFEMREVPAGLVFDVGTSLDDLSVLYRKKGGKEASFQDPNALDEMEQDLGDHLARRDSQIGESRSRATASSLRPLNWENDTPNSPSFRHLLGVLDDMWRSKNTGARDRLSWQVQQAGGQGEPFYRDSEGFDIAIQMTIDHGRRVYAEKWGHRDCDLIDSGLGPDDAWKVLHDWND